MKINPAARKAAAVNDRGLSSLFIMCVFLLPRNASHAQPAHVPPSDELQGSGGDLLSSNFGFHFLAAHITVSEYAFTL